MKPVTKIHVRFNHFDVNLSKLEFLNHVHPTCQLVTPKPHFLCVYIPLLYIDYMHLPGEELCN